MAEKESLETPMKDAFETRTVFEADDKRLNEYLGWLATEPVPNDYVQHAMIVRCLVINAIKTDRFIKAANRRNTWLTIIIVLLSALAVGVSFDSGQQNRETIQQIERLVEFQKQEVQLIKE